MEGISFEFQSKGIALSCLHWPTQKTPKATIIIVHGFGEHQGRYLHVCRHFVDNGFQVVTYDQRGHGTTPGKRGHFSDYNLLLNDLQCLIDMIIDKFSGNKIFLYGHSFGGNLVGNYLLKSDITNLNGAVITSPWFKLAFEPPLLKLLLAKLAKRIAPSFSEPNGLDANDLSHDMEVVSAYQNDDLVHDKISASAFSQIYEAGQWALEQKMDIDLPILLVHGDNDKITSCEASKQFAALHKNNCTLKIWPGLKHETHNELNKEEVIRYSIEWISRQIN